MLDLRRIRDDPEAIRRALERRCRDFREPIEQVVRLDEARRRLLARSEELKAERNRASQAVAEGKRAGRDVTALVARLKGVSEEIKALDAEVRRAESELNEVLLRLPNLPLPDVPEGDASANRVLRTWGDQPAFAFPPRPHWDLGTALGIMDLERGAKIAGSGFPLFTGAGARLVRALVNFMVDLHVREHGYVEIAPPYLVRSEAALGTGQLPDLDQNMYVTTDGLYLIPTAEVPVTNVRREEILTAEELPLGYVAYSPCFRREAGAHGRETRGLIRVHQFDKVELVRFATPETSAAEHEKLLAHAEAVLRRLELPYRVVLLAAGDLGFASAKTYDLEVWAAGVGMWLEASSASSFTDFQARRANIRYRPYRGAKPLYVHTLNASGVALPRTLVALLENNQEEDGSVRIPEALVPYAGTDRLTPRR